MSDGRFICGRCKQTTYVGWSSLSGHYCGICRRFICRDCWDLTAHACVDCTDLAEERVGLVAARLRLQELRRVRRQILELDDGMDDGTDAASTTRRDAKRGLLAIKFADLSAEVARAVHDVPPAEARAAERVRAALDREALITRDAIGPAPEAVLPPPSDLEPPPADPTPPLAEEAQGPWRPSTWLSIGAGAAVVALALAFALGPTAAPAPGAAGIPEASEVEGQVAAGEPSQAPRQGEPVRVTFDSVVTRQTPTGWTATGGTAQVVPFPNPVDRSLRIAVNGGTASACSRVRIGPAGRVSMDLHVGRGSRVSISIGRGQAAASLLVDRQGAARTQPRGRAAATRVAPGEWYAVDFELGSAITLGGRDGGDRERLNLAASPGLRLDAPQRVCVAIQAASTGEVHVDNLVHGE